MEKTELEMYIRLARERAGFDVPVLAARLVGNRLELHLLGGERLTFSLSELQPTRTSGEETPAPTAAKKRAPKPKPEYIPSKRQKRPSSRSTEGAQAKRGEEA